MRLTHEGLQRIRHRHLGYRLTLGVELLLLALLPLAQRVPWLLSVLLSVLARSHEVLQRNLWRLLSRSFYRQYARICLQASA